MDYIQNYQRKKVGSCEQKDYKENQKF